VGVSAPPSSLDRSPSDLALSSDGRYALTANTTAHTVSLIDLVTGKVLSEVGVGQRPFGIALSPDSRCALVTNGLSNTVTLLEVQPPQLKVSATIPVGEEPRGVAFSPDGDRAYVALAGENMVVALDIATRKIAGQIKVGTEPWHLALTADGSTLAVGNARSQDVSVVDTTRQEVKFSVRLKGRNARHLALDPQGTWVYLPHISEQGRPTTRQNIDQGWVIANRLSRCNLKKEGPREAMALDPQGQAFGDVDGVAVSPNGNEIALTAAGTHELILLRLPLPFMSFGGPPDHLDPGLRNEPQRFRRIPLGGRPLGVQFLPDGKSLVVANYLLNCVQVVDFEKGVIVKTIALGGPAQPSLARRGEALFYDATRSFHNWYSCNTCHVEGHTNGGNFDTANDGSYYTTKKTLSLRGVTKTGPWTWHGWQKSLRALARDSFTKSMQGDEPTEAELDAMMAYLETLDWRPALRRKADGSLNEAAKRGKTLFQAKGCNTCHAAPHYTTPAPYLVGLEAPEDAYKGYNPPSLRNVGTRAPYLHDGRAWSLETVLTQFHRPSRLSGKPDFTPDELKDVIEFLKSL
jgi:YVTN family beta-propeller protein